VAARGRLGRLNYRPIRFPISSPGAASALIGRIMTSDSIISPALAELDEINAPEPAICRYWR
jgi:hypothetical protein